MTRVHARHLLAVGAGLVGLSAYVGAAGLATGSDPHLRHLTDRLPLGSPVLGAAGLTAVVAVPHTILAAWAWRGDPRTDAGAVGAGSLLVGWIVVEARVLGETSFLDAVYLGAGLAIALSGRRFLGRLSAQREHA